MLTPADDSKTELLLRSSQTTSAGLEIGKLGSDATKGQPAFVVKHPHASPVRQNDPDWSAGGCDGGDARSAAQPLVVTEIVVRNRPGVASSKVHRSCRGSGKNFSMREMVDRFTGMLSVR
jgi:hypothetical protein